MSQAYASSTGQSFTDAGFLDAHFEANRKEYRELLDKAGIERGWHVLDAGCGGGGFLPLLAEAVGADGRIAAIDLAPENVETVRKRVDESRLPCPVEATTADLRELPFSDNTFDAVWLANVLMYVVDDDLPRVLSERMRVVRPGGVVASKEGDGELMRQLPVPIEHRAPYHHSNVVIPAFHRARLNLHLYRRAGLEDVWAKSILVERWAPLDDTNRQHMLGLLLSVDSRSISSTPRPSQTRPAPSGNSRSIPTRQPASSTTPISRSSSRRSSRSVASRPDSWLAACGPLVWDAEARTTARRESAS